MRAWWSGRLDEFRSAKPRVILGTLATRLVEAHSINRETQIIARRAQIDLLRSATSDLDPSCRLLLEYPLLRLGSEPNICLT